jgi:putrescine aminotransferase
MNSKQQMDINELQKLDSQHHLHPFTDAKELNEQGTRIIVKADGVYIWDAQDNKLLDGMAGLWCVNAGYGRKEIAEAAYEQLQQLPYYNSFFQCTTPPAIELSTLLAELAPAHINHVFFTGSGSESNDTVVRMVRRFWDLKGEPQKSVIISRKNAYHGSTMAGASLGGMRFMHEQGGLPLPGIVHIDQPYWFGEAGDLDKQEFGLKVARQLEEKILQLGLDRVAAFIAEPIQGAGGVIIPPDSYWPEIQRICDKYGILLIVDEVICGFGRTGKWFGSDYYNITPDFMSIAKGLTSGYLPMGGVMVSDRVADELISKGGELAHGYTYSGHPVAAAVALANVKILRDEGIIETVDTDTGPYLQRRWQELGEHPLVGESRGVGFLGALELVSDKLVRSRYPNTGKVGGLCRDISIKNGLVMRAVGDTMIISPPLVASRENIDELVDKAKLTLDQTLERIPSIKFDE